MKQIIVFILVALSLILLYGCEKEKIVESTEYIETTEYVQLPPDTVFVSDTLMGVDSVFIYDTTIQTVWDTVVQQVTVYDTIVTVQQNYDTVTIIDTILTVQCNPNEHFAFAALQYHTDPLVLEFINQEFGFSDGWIFYLSEFQSDLSTSSSSVYDIYGFIDYWTPDWSAYYPLEYYWRITYVSGDPANPNNWTLSEPPAASGEYKSVVRMKSEAAESPSMLR